VDIHRSICPYFQFSTLLQTKRPHLKLQFQIKNSETIVQTSGIRLMDSEIKNDLFQLCLELDLLIVINKNTVGFPWTENRVDGI
jgi:hypothetical protein